MISTLPEVETRPTSLEAVHVYTPASRAVTAARASSICPSRSKVMTARRLGRNLTPSRYQHTPTEGYASTIAEILSSSPKEQEQKINLN